VSKATAVRTQCAADDDLFHSLFAAWNRASGGTAVFNAFE